jgi:hypothetical protein
MQSSVPIAIGSQKFGIINKSRSANRSPPLREESHDGIRGGGESPATYRAQPPLLEYFKSKLYKIFLSSLQGGQRFLLVFLFFALMERTQSLSILSFP